VSGEEDIVISWGARLLRSLRAKPLRTLAVLLLVAAGLALGALNLWAWHHLREANRLAERQQFAEAYADYAECLRVWRWSASTHFLAGRTARRAGLYEEAGRHLAESGKAMGSASGTPLPLALEALLLQAQSGDISEVEDVLWGYVKKDSPETPLILEAMAQGYRRVLRLGAALRCLQMLLAREPDNVGALVLRGWIREGGEPEDASKDYRRALELNPGRDDARQSLARILIHERPDEARSLFEELMARQPNNLDVLRGLAEAYRAVGQPEKARPIFDALLAKNPHDSRALAGLGSLTLAAGDETGGEALLRRAIAADPGNADAHYQLYLCLAQQPGRGAEAATQRNDHKRVEADRTRLAQIAVEEMTRTPNDPNLHYELGIIYLRNGKPDVGVRWLYSALKVDPNHHPSHQALGDYFERIGDSEKAAQHRGQLRPEPAKPSPDQP
jgi:tetratricopeptide (TPR) repeat protein